MGRSYRSALNSGDIPKWEEKLREALGLIGDVCASIYECVKDEDQYDNAADDGALRERLIIAASFIESELPKKKEVQE